MAARTPPPPSTTTSHVHFLGIELSNEQLRGAVVDEHLGIQGVETVDFDTELPEYQTRQGFFTAPGDTLTVPIEMWIRGLDRLFEKLRMRFDLSKIKAIGGCAQLMTIWWRQDAQAALASLSSSEQLHTQLLGNAFSVVHLPVSQDTSTQSQSLTLESTLGAPGANTAAHLSLAAAQILKVRESNPEAWSSTGRVQLASAFLASILLGKWAPMSESEVMATGLWSHPTNNWDDTVLELLGGGKDQGERLRSMLGNVETFGGQPIGTISSYFVERYGLNRDAILTPFTSEHLSTYLSISPSPSDAILSFGPTDVLMIAAQHYIPSRLYNLQPHPAQHPSEKRKYIATLLSRNADTPRALVRDMYTKSWSAFDRLVSVMPPGGSIGLDDKLFSFWVLQGESFPFAHVKGIYRFETGIKVNEFRDLRANPRSLMESQILSFRVRYARMLATGLLPHAVVANPRKSAAFANFGMSFDPYDASQLPRRIITVGSAANFPSVVNLVGDVFNAPVFTPVADSTIANAGPTARPATAIATAPPTSLLTPHSAGGVTPGATQGNQLPPGTVAAPSRASAAIGGAYIARWAWKRHTRPGDKHETFEEEIRTLLRKAHAGNLASAPTPVGNFLTGAHGFNLPRPSALATMPAFKEDDDEDEEPVSIKIQPDQKDQHSASGYRQSPSLSSLSSSAFTSSTSTTLVTPSSSQGNLASLTLNTSPSVLNNGATNGGPMSAAPQSSYPVNITVSPMSTDDADLELGLVKVSEADYDSFQTYAAIVPEYARLEGLLVRALM